MLLRLDSVMIHVCKLGNWLMEAKGKLCKVLGISCEFGHAEKGTEDWDQSCVSLLEKLEALSLQQTKFLHPPWVPAVSLRAPCGPTLLCRCQDLPPPCQCVPPHLASDCIDFWVIWNKEMYLLVTLPSLNFFSTACFFLFLHYSLHWHPQRRVLWKSSQQVKVMVRTEL